jgi:hypothetical protein
MLDEVLMAFWIVQPERSDIKLISNGLVPELLSGLRNATSPEQVLGRLPVRV